MWATGPSSVECPRQTLDGIGSAHFKFHAAMASGTQSPRILSASQDQIHTLGRCPMISAEKSQNALRTMNHVLVLVRKMAYDRVDQKQIADVLDIAEYLPRLLADERDQTSAFRDCLGDLAARWRDFGSALELFDGPTLKWPW